MSSAPLRYPPVNPKLPQFWHGADYYPEQWPAETMDEDIRMMKLARCNVFSLGVFAWSSLEPEEGRYTLDWLDRTMDKLADNGMFAALATPSAAQPAWMSHKYPEVCRVRPEGHRGRHGERGNWCFTSPVYREKCADMSRRLAERYRAHPALLLWHVSNEVGVTCHCNLCEDAFRNWVQSKYGTLDAVNKAWYTAFWSHGISAWSQIESPRFNWHYGEANMHGMVLDWHRFCNDQLVSFLLNEIGPIRELTPTVPVTTNMMCMEIPLDYWMWAKHLDVISWDAYPDYHARPGEFKHAAEFSFAHDTFRCLSGGRPYLIIETPPGPTNNQSVAKLKRPGVHRLACLQGIAHGAESIMYFQWRKSIGGAEKFHAAVVDHCGHENTATFRDVKEVGEILEKIAPVRGCTAQQEVAVICDNQNAWAINGAQGPRRAGRDYKPACHEHYRAFWSRAVPMDVINEECDLAKYKLVIAPMMCMVRPGMAERAEKFVADGGTFVTTYWSGIVDEHDTCFTTGRPGPLRKLMGIWAEETDVLYDDEQNELVPVKANALGLSDSYKCHTFCDLIHPEGAEVVATYGEDYYAGRPALTVNRFGCGEAWYIAPRTDHDFLAAFYNRLIAKLGIKPVLDCDLPEGVTIQMRTDGARRFFFVLNFTPVAHVLRLPEAPLRDMLTGARVPRDLRLDSFGSLVLEAGA